MKIRVGKTSFLSIVFVLAFFPRVWAGESLVKIANVAGRVMDKHSKTEGIFLGDEKIYFDGLEQYLSFRVGLEVGGENGKGERNIDCILKKGIRESGAEIKRLLYCPARLVGSQLASGNSGWDKFVIDFEEDDRAGYFLFENGGDFVSNYKEVSHVAVRNNNGRLEQWGISDKFPQGEEKTVYRMDKSYLAHQMRQNNFINWFQNMVMQANGVGVMILRSGDEEDIESSDMVLIAINLGNLLFNKNGLKEAMFVIGWKSLH